MVLNFSLVLNKAIHLKLTPENKRIIILLKFNKNQLRNNNVEILAAIYLLNR